MFKKLIILLSVLVLCSSSLYSFAQDYKKAADYLRGRYVQRLMERKYGHSNIPFRDFNKINAPISKAKLEEINRKLHEETPNTDESFHLIKEKIDSLFDYNDSSLVALLVDHDSIPLMVGNTVTLYKWVTDVKPGAQSLDLESLKDEVNPLVRTKKRVVGTNPHSGSVPPEKEPELSRTGVSAIWLFIVALLSILLTFLISRRYYTDFYRKKVADEIRKKFEEITKKNMEISDLRNRMSRMQQELMKPKTLSDMQTSESVQNQPRNIPAGQSASNSDNHSGILYAESILNGYFVHVSSEYKPDVIYRIRTNGTSEATFDIEPRAFKKVLANSSFLDGCTIQILNNPTSVEILDAGKSRYDKVSGRWLITQKLNIILK